MKSITCLLLIGSFLLTSCSSSLYTLNPEISARICTTLGQAKGCGTAYNLSYNGKTYGITNAHVCSDMTDKTVFNRDGKRMNQKVKVIKILKGTDICITERINHLKNLKPTLKKLKVGQLTYIQGFPYGKPNVSIGKITGAMLIRGQYHEGAMISVTNYVNYGNSGSPVVDNDGYVVGTLAMKNMMNEEK